MTDVLPARSFLAIAPGKIFILGEYAVLAGHHALVGSVKRYVHATYRPTDDPTLVIESALFASPERVRCDEAVASLAGPAGRVVAGALAAGEISGLSAGQIAPGRITVDSQALYSRGRKLGFGSSAAVVVATAGAMLAAHQGEANLVLREALFGPARRWHNQAQRAEGSGGDVAASLFGGLCWFRAAGNQSSEVEAVPNTAAALGLFTHLEAASTPRHMGSVQRLRQAEPVRFEQLMQHLAEQAMAGKEALLAKNSRAFLGAVKMANRWLTELGDAAGIPVATRRHRELVALCEARGLACKPAGAGGGDLSLIAASDAKELAVAIVDLAEHGFAIQPLELSDHGLRFGNLDHRQEQGHP